MRILILNCYSKIAIAVMASLDPDYTLWGGAGANTSLSRKLPHDALKPNRLSGITIFTSPSDDVNRFIDEIVAATVKHRFDVIFPTGSTATNFLARHRPEIEERSGARIPVADFGVFQKFADKWRTYAECVEAGVPIPKSTLLTQDSLGSIREFRYPVVVKPRTLTSARGVEFFDSPDDLERRLSGGSSLLPPEGREDDSYILQERVDGELHDACFCAKDGMIGPIFTQRRLMTLFDFGGGGIINESTYEPELIGFAEALARQVGWSGPANCDFVKLHDGGWVLLECNPRFWGTSHLSVAAGMRIPQAVIDLLILGKEVNRMDTYEIGLVYKWLIPDCVYSWVQAPRTLGTLSRRIRKTLFPGGTGREVTNLSAETLRRSVALVLNGRD